MPNPPTTTPELRWRDLYSYLAATLLSRPEHEMEDALAAQLIRDDILPGDPIRAALSNIVRDSWWTEARRRFPL